MSAVNWHRTNLTRDLIRCDLCGKKADTVHFLTDGEYPGAGDADDRVEAIFACPLHDAGGYYIELDSWFDPQAGVAGRIAEKTWGQAALAATRRRFDQILRDAAENDRDTNL